MPATHSLFTIGSRQVAATSATTCTPDGARERRACRGRATRSLCASGALAAALLLAGCATHPAERALAGTVATPALQTAPVSGYVDATPRIAVISAFAPEIAALQPLVERARHHRINGVEFTTGVIAGKEVVLFTSGISMTNAAMNTQLVLDRFRVTHIVFSGIAGGVNPQLHIGDVAVPEQWGQYMEWLMAREVAPGQFRAPGWIQPELTRPAFGMMHPRPVEVRTATHPTPERKFWFAADPAMLAVARQVASQITLEQCVARQCLTTRPTLVVGGNGVSGQAFVDNEAFRQYAFRTFEANVLDMETAATAMVAYSNGVPYIAFRSLSDLAGGGEGANEMDTFMHLAARNAALVLHAFLRAWR